mgnify:CR=1 FL=1
MRNKRILSFLVALISLLTLLPAASAASDVYVGQTFYFGKDASGNPYIYPGRLVEARVIAVAEKVLRVDSLARVQR